MEQFSIWIPSLSGGVIIGIAVSLMLLLNGRITGISGMVNGILHPKEVDFSFKFLFLAGLVAGGFLFNLLNKSELNQNEQSDLSKILLAGILVGFGTILGNGCTSGHGICGVSRLSPRSILATILFICAGIFSVYFFKEF